MNKLPDIDLWLPHFFESERKTIEIIHNKYNKNFRLINSGGNFKRGFEFSNLKNTNEWLKRQKYIHITNSNLKLFILYNFFNNKEMETKNE